MSDEHIACAFCSGRGKDPFPMIASFSTCRVCGGLGKVLVRTPLAWCSHCLGTGKVKTFACPMCGGKAVTPRSRAPLRIQACSGPRDNGAPATPLLKRRAEGLAETC